MVCHFLQREVMRLVSFEVIDQEKTVAEKVSAHSRPADLIERLKHCVQSRTLAPCGNVLSNDIGRLISTMEIVHWVDDSASLIEYRSRPNGVLEAHAVIPYHNLDDLLPNEGDLYGRRLYDARFGAEGTFHLLGHLRQAVFKSDSRKIQALYSLVYPALVVAAAAEKHFEKLRQIRDNANKAN